MVVNVKNEVLSDIDFIDYDPGYFTGFGSISTISYDKKDEVKLIVDIDGEPIEIKQEKRIGFY